MRVVFMGTPDFASGILDSIVKAGYEVVGVVTQPDKPKGRGKGVSMPDVKVKALEYDLPVFQPAKVKAPEAVEVIRNMKPDVIVVVAFGQIISKEILDMPKYGCVNVHGSLLPAYRGAAPIQWAVIDGLKKTGVTTIQMDESIDTGDIIMKEELELDAKETGGSLFDRLCTLGCEVIVKTLKAIEDGKATRTKQDDALSNYAKKLDKSTGNINFTEDAVKIERLIRGLNPWPSAYTHINGKTLKIWDADVVPGKESVEPGVVTEVDKDSFIVQCNNGALKILEVQMEGKKRMTTDAFLRGYQIEEGTKLGE